MTSASPSSLRPVLPSLIATPWLLMITTSSSLYLRNQADLHYRFDVLYTFVGAALLILLAGVLIAAGARKRAGFRALLWGYYLLAPLFFVLQGIHAWDEATPGLPLGALAVALYIVSTIALARYVSPAKAIPVFTLVGVALVMVDVFLFASSFQRAEQDQTVQPVATKPGDRTSNRPNIYHLVLDEYQTDMFQLTLSDEVRHKLSGFTFYEQATALFGRTEMSLPSIFSGRNYDFISAPVDYQKAAFSLDRSIFGPLKSHGYETRAVMFPVFSFVLEGFDHVSFHPISIRSYRMAITLFVKVWAFSVLPQRVSELFMDTTDVDQLKYKNLLPVSAPVESYENMLKTISTEGSLPGSNRYQFIHLLLPHFPYVLSKDCGHKANVRTSPLEQSQCATSLVLKFIDRLKQLGRFRDSLIIIQSDHGARFELKDGRLKGIAENDTSRFGAEFSKARARSLLLVKPPGTGDERDFVISNAPVSLLDVAPTIIQATGMTSNLEFDGRSVLDPGLDSKRTRYYYFYNKRGTQGQHIDKMTRFRIEDSGYINEGLVKSGEFK